MKSVLLWLVLIGVEGWLIMHSLKRKEHPRHIKHISRLLCLALFAILIFLEVFHWGFQWVPLFALLLIQGLLSMLYFVKNRYSLGVKNNSNNIGKTFRSIPIVLVGLGRLLLLTLVIIPTLIFPRYEGLEITGPYTVSTESHTFTDPNRIELFTDTGELRQVSVQFWYPENPPNKKTFPLVIFSHGSFGFRGSNYSTFMELASQGYVVASIDHTYHAFFTSHADGRTILVNTKFMNDAMSIQSGSNTYTQQEIYEITHDWLKLRTEDMSLVLNTILDNSSKNNTEGVYQLIDTQKIGLFGHSLGGATAAELGRQRDDINAVIVLDGTMLGEQIDFIDGQPVFNPRPYPVPLLNIYNEKHYAEAILQSENYGNIVASTQAINAHNVVFMGSGHLNFTDLPLSSPFLARMLGTGEIDSRYCIETMNKVILDYFNFFLKDSGQLNLQDHY